ncbi:MULTISPECIES: restriction endonuclease subunit S [Halobacterium]|uniref:restriction endonuclease subunit S n=1 Tax=Halobacterium TaxID=2239 RepID=UPI0009E8C549|nr:MULTISPECIES: restriction endonuclease subunit S [Halobacterium]MCG1001891.1 restriction endonuclease subunit S [Halobacterium noricense]
MSEDATLDEFVKNEENPSNLELGPIEINIPPKWDSEELSDLFNLISGNNYTGEHLSEEDNGGRVFLTLKSVNKGGGFNQDSIKYYTGEVNQREIVEPGELLIANTDVTQDGDIVGYSIRVPEFESEREIAASMDLSILRPKTKDVNLPYIEHLLQTEYIHSRMRAFSAGSTVLHLNTDLVKSLSLPLPPLPEQRKIATVLSTVDRAIEKSEEVIAQTERLREGAMQDLFSRGVRGYDDFQETKYGIIPASWEVKPVREIADRIGSGGTPNTDKEGYYGGDIEWVKTDDLNSGLVESAKTTITSRGLDESAAKLFPEGTVVFAMYGGALGQNGRLGMEAAMNQACCGIVTDESEMNSYLLHQQLIHRKKQLTALSAGTHQQNISQSMIEKFEVFVPPLDEQMEMVDILKSIERTMEANTNEKERLKRLKHGLMQDLLSGTARTTDTNIEVPEEIAQYG